MDIPERAEGELRIMARVAARDVVAFEALYRDHHRGLSRFLLNLTRSPALADEVLNDTMMAVWNKPEGFRGESRLSTWIFAIGWRQAMRALKRQDQPLPDPVEEGPTDGEQPIAAIGPDPLARRRIDAAMQRLSVDHRTVLDLTYFHELSCREIAEIMACPVDTVKTRMFHARRQLRRLLPGTTGDWI